MAHVRTTYLVYNHNGTGVRHHHFGTANNITAVIDDNYPGTTDSAPGTHTANGWPILPFGGNNIPFAFMSVLHAADGNHLYTGAGNQTFPVGTQDVSVTVVYVPAGGFGPNGGPGIWVDAFNVDTGSFSDDLNFITVLTPPTPPDNVDNAKTTLANQEGVISSLQPEHIRASANIDGGTPFQEWKKVCPVESISTDADFNMTQNESGEIWFAFYQRQSASVSIGTILGKIEYSLGKWVKDDYCGTPYPHHWGPPGPPFRISIDQKVLDGLPADRRKQLQGFMKEYPAIALKGYQGMTEVISLLKSVEGLTAGIKTGQR